MGKLIAEIPSSPYDNHLQLVRSPLKEEMREKKEDQMDPKAAMPLKFCSTGDLVVRFRFTGTDLSNDLAENFALMFWIGR